MVTIQKDSFGKTKDGSDVSRFTLANKNQMTVQILDYGGTISSIVVPDKHGKLDDVCLGFDDMEGYEKNPAYIGGLIGRVANRIAGGKFSLDGKEYVLPVNNEPNFLHGGFKGFDKVMWTARVENNKLILTYVSPDGEEKFPGEVTSTVVFELTDDNQLKIDYTVTTTKPTPVGLTSHSYFNLGGHGCGKIDDHFMTIKADTYLPVDENVIPTGEIRSLDGLPEDLRKMVRLGDVINDIPGGNGFNCNYNLNHTGQFQQAARAEHRGTGRYLECYTTEPAIQLYTAYAVPSMAGKGGAKYGAYCAFAWEAQHYPDSVNHKHFPNIILHPGETYRQTTSYKFGLID
ncbi:galactose mutarotase-like [Gigantopelta aegis]|uniref:galactose mutarotase-like n=1 Tax=Gigantopelta aegis TaxID=1735272 RepID=UPI001B88D3D0|nr:galactose mutarotase-like [Gigantopelta aegis]